MTLKYKAAEFLRPVKNGRFNPFLSVVCLIWIFSMLFAELMMYSVRFETYLASCGITSEQYHKVSYAIERFLVYDFLGR